MLPGMTCLAWHAAAVRPTTHASREVAVAVNVQKNIGFLLLAVWLILYGLTGLVSLALPGLLMAILALLAGILILVGR